MHIAVLAQAPDLAPMSNKEFVPSRMCGLQHRALLWRRYRLLEQRLSTIALDEEVERSRRGEVNDRGEAKMNLRTPSQRFDICGAAGLLTLKFQWLPVESAPEKSADRKWRGLGADKGARSLDHRSACATSAAACSMSEAVGNGCWRLDGRHSGRAFRWESMRQGEGWVLPG